MSNANGVWNVTVKTPIGDQHGTMTIEVDGDSFTGEFTNPMDTQQIHDGKIDGNDLTWLLKVAKPIKMTIKGKASIDGDDLRGKMKMGMMGSATITGTRKS